MVHGEMTKQSPKVIIMAVNCHITLIVIAKLVSTLNYQYNFSPCEVIVCFSTTIILLVGVLVNNNPEGMTLL